MVHRNGLGAENFLGKEGPVPAVLDRGQSVQREAAGAPLVPTPGAVGRPCPPPGAGGSASSAQLLLLSFPPLFFSFSPFLFPLATFPPPHSVFLCLNYLLNFISKCFQKLGWVRSPRVQKCQRAQRSWAVLLSEQLQKQVPSAGSFAKLARIFARPQSAKLFCVCASELFILGHSKRRIRRYWSQGDLIKCSFKMVHYLF